MYVGEIQITRNAWGAHKTTSEIWMAVKNKVNV